jgi:hypothetical protein
VQFHLQILSHADESAVGVAWNHYRRAGQYGTEESATPLSEKERAPAISGADDLDWMDGYVTGQPLWAILYVACPLLRHQFSRINPLVCSVSVSVNFQ